MKCLGDVEVKSKICEPPRDIVPGSPFSSSTKYGPVYPLASECTPGYNFGTVPWLFQNFNWWLHVPVHI